MKEVYEFNTENVENTERRGDLNKWRVMYRWKCHMYTMFFSFTFQLFCMFYDAAGLLSSISSVATITLSYVLKNFLVSSSVLNFTFVFNI